jgi:dimethylargininase
LPLSARFASPARAWLRAISDRLPDCLRDNALPIDVGLARVQHAAYAAALADAGVAVEVLPEATDCPDCVYIEDEAVLLGPTTLITTPGAPSRRAEVAGVLPVLQAAGPVQRMTAEATLDGGDVLRAGDTLFVGLTARTSREGLASLRALADPLGLTVEPVPVHAGLHLKSAVTLAAPGLLVLVRGQVDPAPFARAGLEVLQVDEPHGGNVLALADRVLVSAASPRAGALLRERGLRTVEIDVSELTCLSLRQPPPGAWCA